MTNYRIVCKTNRVGKNFYLIQYQIFWFWWRYFSYMVGHDYSEYYIAETINEAECKILELKAMDLEDYNKKIIKTTIIT